MRSQQIIHRFLILLLGGTFIFFGLRVQRLQATPPNSPDHQTAKQAASLMVNSLADSDDGVCDAAPGDCTLRETIAAANSNPGPDTITFSVSGVISTTGLPPLTDDGTVLDASGVFGAGPLGANAPGIELHGPHTDDSTGFLLEGANNVRISGFFITGFSEGIWLKLGASNNIIGTNGDGSSDAAERNVISGMVGSNHCNAISGAGIQIEGGTTSDNIVAGNFIGLDVSGTAPLANAYDGIYLVNAQNNLIGGSSPAARNIISGNRCNGVHIEGSAALGNTISGNYIGTDVTGTVGVGNGLNSSRAGVAIIGASNNVIGGLTPGSGNVISGNYYSGLNIDDNGVSQSAFNNQVLGNFIGLDYSGTAAIGNALYGLRIYADQTIVGGVEPGAGNIISGNDSHGIIINAAEVTVVGNYIGTDRHGIVRVGNGSNGIYFFGQRNVIGGSTAAERNIISGNEGYGVVIYGSSTTANRVRGNYIGSDVSGSNDLGNDDGGILINHDAWGNIIGGTEAGEGNVISGNGPGGFGGGGGHGIRINVRSNNNQIIGNFIGSKADRRSALRNSGNGVYIRDAFANIIGGTAAGAGNLIGGNSGHGVSIYYSGAFNSSGPINVAYGNLVLGNSIGVLPDGSTPLGNGQDGVNIEASNDNRIGGLAPAERNVIAFNDGHGVAIQSGISNTIRANAIFANDGLGIDLGLDGPTPNDPTDGDSGANNLQNYPVITSATSLSGNTFISGTLSSAVISGTSSHPTTYSLDFFANNDCDPSNYGQGEIYLGSAEVIADNSGQLSFTIPLSTTILPPIAFMAATATGPNDNTSEFSACVPVGTAVSEPPPATTYAKVLDRQGRPVSRAQLYWNGHLVRDEQGGAAETDILGNLILERLNPQPGDTLVALAPQAEQQTGRKGHDGWAYRIFQTTLSVGPQGNTEAFTIARPGMVQTLTVRPENALVLFNLVVSIEWDATLTYTGQISQAIDHAADFLYDASDGQMTFGQVAIYDRAEHWAEADIQISAKNVVQPHAHIGGLSDDDRAHLIRVGRFWDGNSGNQGAWSQSNGFKTLVHEFGHYGLGLYDEYFGYDLAGNDLAGQHDAFCSGPENRNPGGEATNLSIMDYHYTSSELADAGNWTAWCQQTAQHQLNHGEADWQTITRLYRDPTGQNRWQLVTPDQRAGAGNVVAGPAAIPATLGLPVISATNTGPNPDPLPLTVCRNGQPYGSGAWVTLYQAGKAMDQGLTGAAGEIQILGAQTGDTLRVVSLDGVLSGLAQVPPDSCLSLNSLGARSDNQTEPYLRMWPTGDVAGVLDGLRLVATLPFTAPLNYALTEAEASAAGQVGNIFYDDVQGDHRLKVGYLPQASSGYARVTGAGAGRSVDINVDYRLQRAGNISPTTLFSNDGNFELYLEAGSLPAETHFLIASPWGLPGPLPLNLDIIGEAYEITASGSLAGLAKPALLRLHYDTAAGSAFERLDIYRWDFNARGWEAVGGELDQEQQEMATTVSELGVYALLGVRATTNIYLPVVIKN